MEGRRDQEAAGPRRIRGQPRVETRNARARRHRVRPRRPVPRALDRAVGRDLAGKGGPRRAAGIERAGVRDDSGDRLRPVGRAMSVTRATGTLSGTAPAAPRAPAPAAWSPSPEGAGGTPSA